MAVNNVRLGLYGALTGSLLALGGCHTYSLSSKYDASADLIQADSLYGNNDGELSRPEAANFIVRRWLGTAGFTKEEAKEARALGEDAQNHIPKHAKVFLEVLSQFENIYGINAEESSK